MKNYWKKYIFIKKPETRQKARNPNPPAARPTRPEIFFGSPNPARAGLCLKDLLEFLSEFIFESDQELVVASNSSFHHNWAKWLSIRKDMKPPPAPGHFKI